MNRTPRRRNRAFLSLLVAGVLGGAASGCLPSRLGLLPPPAPPPPAESLVLRGDTLITEKPPEPGSPEARLAGAHELFRRNEYSKAADLFHTLTDKSRYSESMRVEATFYEAECLRLQGRYPPAADTYTKLLKISPSNPYRDQAARHLFEIANYWLDDTRLAMKEAREVREGKRWFTNLRLVHFEKSKPLADEEGRALEKLEQVHYVDVDDKLGLGSRALFLCGSVMFFRENYAEADHYFTQLHKNYPRSPFAQQAVELGVICKQMSTGGPDYDGRKVAEARELVHVAVTSFPEVTRDKEKKDFYDKQLFTIALQQAAKDYKTAEFYRRTGHPGSAWFYYDLIRIRYPGLQPYYNKATQRMHELKAEVEKEKGKGTVPPIRALDGETFVPGQPLGAASPLPRLDSQQPEGLPPPRPLPSDLGR